MKKLGFILIAFMLSIPVFTQDWIGEYNVRVKVKNHWDGKEHYTMGQIKVYRSGGETFANINFSCYHNGPGCGGNVRVNASSVVMAGKSQPDSHPANHVQHTFNFRKVNQTPKGSWQIHRLNTRTGRFDLQYSVSF